MHIEVESIPPEKLAEAPQGEPSSAIRERVERARSLQRQRYAGEKIACNARLGPGTIDKYCPLTARSRAIMNAASEKMGLSNRAYTRVIKVARTIADLAGSPEIDTPHVSEALQYRIIDAKYWG